MHAYLVRLGGVAVHGARHVADLRRRHVERVRQLDIGVDDNSELDLGVDHLVHDVDDEPH